jgi:hypothetical protein
MHRQVREQNGMTHAVSSHQSKLIFGALNCFAKFWSFENFLRLKLEFSKILKNLLGYN